MDAKKVALLLSGIIALILLVDFTTRLTVDVEVQDNKDENVQAQQEATGEAPFLTIEQVQEILAWSDKVPTPEEIAAQQQAAQAAVAPPPTPPQPKIDVHEQVRQLIAGNVSKHLLGDQLLTLKGVFYDQHNFAVVEVENIISKEKKYYRAKLNDIFATNHLAQIGKNHVLIKNGDQEVRLRMFEGAL